jgi:curved DNA-binding protein
MLALDRARELLGVERDATPPEVEAAFRRLAMQYHPDKHHGSEEARRVFAVIVEAYEHVMRVQRPPESEPRSRSHSRFHPETAIHDPGTYPEKGLLGLDHVPLTLSLQEALSGAVKTVVLHREGRSRERKAVLVRVPPLSGHGTVLRLERAGFVPLAGAFPQDVAVIIRLPDDQRFSVRGKDLIVRVAAPPRTAAEGGRLRIPTPRGPRWVAIPPGSSSRFPARLPGMGLERGGARGDLYLTVSPRSGPARRPVSLIRSLFRRTRAR